MSDTIKGGGGGGGGGSISDVLGSNKINRDFVGTVFINLQISSITTRKETAGGGGGGGGGNGISHVYQQSQTLFTQENIMLKTPRPRKHYNIVHSGKPG